MSLCTHVQPSYFRPFSLYWHYTIVTQARSWCESPSSGYRLMCTLLLCSSWKAPHKPKERIQAQAGEELSVNAKLIIFLRTNGTWNFSWHFHFLVIHRQSHLFRATEQMYSVHQSLFYARHFSIAAIITLKDILSSSLMPCVLSIPHFPEPPQCRTTASVYCLMGPSGLLMDFSTAQSFYFINTALPFLWLVLCLPAPLARSHQTSALIGGHSLMPAQFSATYSNLFPWEGTLLPCPAWAAFPQWPDTKSITWYICLQLCSSLYML